MDYTPTTIGPIDSSEIVRIANETARECNIGSDGEIPVFVSYDEKYDEFGVRAAIRIADFDSAALIEYFFEDPDLETIDPEFQLRGEAQATFRNKLEQYANEADLDAPYNEVNNQIDIETEDFGSEIYADWTEAIDQYKAGPQNFLDALSITVDQANAQANEGHLKESAIFPEQYTAVQRENLISYMVAELDAEDMTAIVNEATGEEKETNELFGDDNENLRDVLESVDLDELGEAIAHYMDGNYTEGLLLI